MSKLLFGGGRALGLQRLKICAAAGAPAWMFIWLSACATTPPASPAAVAAPAAAANPVLQAAAAAALNTPVAVVTAQGPATVTVLSDYISGEGQECRGYSLAGAGALPVPGLACHDGTAWREIPPLAPLANPGANPGSQP